MENENAEMSSRVLNNGNLSFHIRLEGNCSKEDFKKIQRLFNRYLKLIEAEELKRNKTN